MIGSVLGVAVAFILPAFDSVYLFYDGIGSTLAIIVGGFIYLISIVSYYEKRMHLFGDGKRENDVR